MRLLFAGAFGQEQEQCVSLSTVSLAEVKEAFAAAAEEKTMKEEEVFGFAEDMFTGNPLGF